jgi:RNA polymerase sigma factor (sigma-70 family)
MPSPELPKREEKKSAMRGFSIGVPDGFAIGDRSAKPVPLSACAERLSEGYFHHSLSHLPSPGPPVDMYHDPIPVNETDERLVLLSLAGDRDAFGRLVARHQAAACAVAYSICGDFHASEDVAQEAFVHAWDKLRELRDAQRFRSWVCGMARNLSLNHMRKTGRRGGRAQETDAGQPDLAASPVENTVSAEESALVWEAVTGLDENYRLPLVLFYREQQSVAAVATALDISEDAARQRLSRGRTLLREALARRVENIFVRTRPGPVFTAGVVAALPPVLAGVGVVATAGTAKAATGGTAATGAAAGGIALAPILASAAVSLAGIFVLFRTMTSKHVPDEVRRRTRRCVFFAFGSTAVFTVWLVWFTLTRGLPLASIGLDPALTLAVTVLLFVVANVIVPLREARRIDRSVFAAGKPECGNARRYESRARFLGLPLVSIAFGSDPARGERRGIARGWFAMGDVAVGGFALGGVAIGFVSSGGIGIGLLSMGGIAIGVLSFGATAVGLFACGALTGAWFLAVGGCALAHVLAIGALAVASKAAFGGVALAAIANDGAEWAKLCSQTWVGPVIRILPHMGWLSLLGVPGLFYAFREIRRKRL